jgi:gliding motility-associated-like protein
MPLFDECNGIFYADNIRLSAKLCYISTNIVMKPALVLLFLLTLLKFTAFSQSRTPNIGFEDGSFNNWVCSSGTIDVNGIINAAPTSPIPGLFTIYGKEAAQVMDTYGNFPVLCPNGSNYSVRINDMSAPTIHNKAQRITYTFQAPSSGPYSIIFNYAVVLQNPNHMPIQQPKFTAFVYDVTDGMYVDCPSFDFVPGTNLPGFQLSTAPGAKNTSTYFKPWSTATIDLRGYLGKTIRLEFTVNDCAVANGTHFGYAYLDVEDSDSIAPITGNSYCIGQTSVDLVGPSGFSQYSWFTADLKTSLHEGQSYKISPAPPDQTTYGLIIHPFDGLGCTDTLYTTVNKINAGFTFTVPDTVYACTGKTFDLTSPAIVAGSDPGLTYGYYADSIGTDFTYNPNLITKSSQNYIRATNSEGCTAILPVYVKFGLPTLTVTSPATVQFPATVDITKTFVHVATNTYAYYTDTVSNKPVANPAAIEFSGTYYVLITDITGCQKWYPINVTITPPDPFSLTAPNAFTPNGDGVNDLFQFNIKGYLEFSNVKIFNRNGQQVYMLRSLQDTWDGTYNGKQLPAGAYYWVFEGTDTYYNTKITKSGSIAIIR